MAARSLDSLPPEILVHIFAYLRTGILLDPKDRHTETAGLDVGGISISRTLRCCAQLAMYHTMYYISNGCPSVAASNIQAILRSRLVSVPRELVLVANSDGGPAEMLSGLQYQGFFTRAWRTVHTIRIVRGEDEGYWDGSYDSRALTELNSALVEHLPNAKHVYNEMYNESAHGRPLLAELIDAKRDVLQSVDFTYTCVENMHTRWFGPSLKSLKLALYCCTLSDFAPRIFAPTIVSLDLRSVHHDDVWSLFYTTAAEHRCRHTALEFSRLESLTMMLAEDHQQPHTQNQPTTPDLMFPKLRRLELSTYPHNADAYLPLFPLDRIRELKLWVWTEDMPVVDVKRMHSLESLTLELCELPDQFLLDSLSSSYLHPLFSTSSRLRCLHLNRPASHSSGSLFGAGGQDIRTFTLPDKIALTHLQRLVVSVVLERGALPRLLPRLPQLRQLELLVGICRPANILEPEYQLCNSPPFYKPLSRSVTYLRTAGSHSEEQGPFAACEQAWLVARLPSLVSWVPDSNPHALVLECLSSIASSDNFAHHTSHLLPILALYSS
ncbi:hypothetical protein GQ54DRAFT_310746 [Martensiomyces pterosporus]|nr:hypothetical protein GQ54DRAFT_310746 [Martensiomyces pterosporus]